ncbi:hypothetical protein [Marinoscillum sp.]|uniref:hypothetical protein n=1 Tax=Marinoscillum sp. TaxID=2024838 RepID=UPI003BAC8AC4
MKRKPITENIRMVMPPVVGVCPSSILHRLKISSIKSLTKDKPTIDRRSLFKNLSNPTLRSNKTITSAKQGDSNNHKFPKSCNNHRILLKPKANTAQMTYAERTSSDIFIDRLM